MLLFSYLKKHRTLALRQEAGDCGEAIRLATRLLRESGSITEVYTTAIEQNLAQNGPYFVLVPGFAMIHAEPGIGVREMGFSLVTLKKPVFFGHPENDPVDIVLCVAAVHRQEMNEEAIVSIMALLEEETLLEGLRKATSLDTFWEYWQNILA